jgi:hypothetical protein
VDCTQNSSVTTKNPNTTVGNTRKIQIQLPNRIAEQENKETYLEQLTQVPLTKTAMTDLIEWYNQVISTEPWNIAVSK